MVRNMYKESAKSEKNGLGPTILWIVFMYVFYIVWGIAEIVLEIKIPPLAKHVVLWALTGWFVWQVIFRFIIEFEFAARKNEFTVERRLGKRSQIVCSVKYENIEDIFTDETKLEIKKYKFFKKYDAVRAFQAGKTIYIVYKFDGKHNMIKLKVSRKMLEMIRSNIALKKEENQ